MKILILVLVAVLSGCATSSHVLVGEARTPISADLVQIYTTAPDQYEEVAILHADSGMALAITDQGKTDAVMNELRERAASLGANGILLTGLGSRSETVGTYVSGTGTTSTARYKTGEAVAIFVPTQEAMHQ